MFRISAGPFRHRKQGWTWKQPTATTRGPRHPHALRKGESLGYKAKNLGGIGWALHFHVTVVPGWMALVRLDPPKLYQSVEHITVPEVRDPPGSQSESKSLHDLSKERLHGHIHLRPPELGLTDDAP